MKMKMLAGLTVAALAAMGLMTAVAVPASAADCNAPVSAGIVQNGEFGNAVWWLPSAAADSYEVYLGATLFTETTDTVLYLPAGSQDNPDGTQNGVTIFAKCGTETSPNVSAPWQLNPTTPGVALTSCEAPAAPVIGFKDDKSASVQPSTNRAPGVTGYRALLDGNEYFYSSGQFSDPNANPLVITGLEADTEYEVTFSNLCVLSNGTAALSTPASTTFTTDAAPVATCPAVTDTTTFSDAPTTGTVSWTASANAESYNLYVDGVFSLNTTNASHLFTGLKADTDYVVGIESVCGTLKSTITTANLSTVAVDGDPVVSALTAGAITDTSINVNWTVTDPNLEGYDIFKNGTKVDHIASNALSYTFTGLTADTSYELGVAAVTDNVAGAVSKTTLKTAVTPVPPVVVAPTLIGPATVSPEELKAGFEVKFVGFNAGENVKFTFETFENGAWRVLDSSFTSEADATGAGSFTLFSHLDDAAKTPISGGKFRLTAVGDASAKTATIEFSSTGTPNQVAPVSNVTPNQANTANDKTLAKTGSDDNAPLFIGGITLSALVLGAGAIMFARKKANATN